MPIDVVLEDLGTIDYKKAWDYQEVLFQKNVDLKIAQRKGLTSEKTVNNLLFCEHPHVYTLGKSGKENHLRLSTKQLKEVNADYYKINRGGDITYHGPGQIVVYPILDLDTYFFTDIHKYMRFLEEVVIRTLKEYSISSERVEGKTGVWIDVGFPNERKICAMGVRASRWITMHGIGFNINADLNYFNYIIPCGIEDKGVTSLHKELGKEVDVSEVKQKLTQHFSDVFNVNYVEKKHQKVPV